jgi:hypothetical protein
MKIVYSLTAAGLKKLVVISSMEDAPQKEPATGGYPVKSAEVEAFRHNGVAGDTVEIQKQLDSLQ